MTFHRVRSMARTRRLMAALDAHLIEAWGMMAVLSGASLVAIRLFI